MNLPTPGYGNVEVNNSGASNSGNTSGGLKKPLIIIAAILGVVIIGATAYFMFSSLNSTDSTKDNSELANEIAPYLPDYTTDEIKEILDTELSQEQQDVANDIIGSLTVPNIEDVDIDEDGTMTYVNGNGDIVVEPPHTDVLEMTDDELQAESDRIDENIQAIIDGNYDQVTLPETEQDPEADNAIDNSNSLDDLEQALNQMGGIGNNGELTDESIDELTSDLQLAQ